MRAGGGLARLPAAAGRDVAVRVGGTLYTGAATTWHALPCRGPRCARVNIRTGEPYPLGATRDGAGVNFALFSEHATNVELCLFDAPGATREAARLPLPARTDHVWHGYLSDVRPGQLYGYRVSGPYDPPAGHRFNPAKLLVDPYAKQIGRNLRWNDALLGHDDAGTAGEPLPDARDSAPFAPLAAVLDPAFDWGSDRPPRIPWHETVIYEVHVKGFTARHPEVSAPLRGTYLGLASEPAVRHFRELGVTAIELLPVHHGASEPRLLARGLTNYWGYNTLAYFAPDTRYATSPESAVADFKTMVRALHQAGLEVILDVVYNHTAEGSRQGPTLSLRGIDNRSYYRLDPRDPAAYLDFTGCGNTLDATHPRARQLIMDSLRYWVLDMHVDGFRFDLASALARGAHEVDRLGAFFDVIRRDPVLSRVKLIAEPWDLGADGYQAGNFPAGWSEWNARYRDTVRRFWRGDGGQAADLATRLAGSSDLYGAGGRGPHASINFVTAHDGFTLADLVSYDAKHNAANGEANRDGSDANLSWNCGVEGATDDPGIARLRARQRRNLMATLLLSQGVPMICGGDEIGRTQAGNNNAYCQDNETSWYDWDLAPAEREFLTFVRAAIDVRRRHPALRRRRFLRRRRGARAADVVWLDPHGGEMTDAAWTAAFVKCLGMRLGAAAPDEANGRGRPLVDDTLLVLLNAHDDAVGFTLPAGERHAPWLLVFDTAQPDPGQSEFRAGRPYRLQGRSVAVLRVPRDPAATLS